MELFGLYEPEMLSPFGGEQLLSGLGSPLEPDSPSNFPDVREIHKPDLRGSAQFDILKATEDEPLNDSSFLPQDVSTGLEFSWMDTPLDLFDIVQEMSDDRGMGIPANVGGVAQSSINLADVSSPEVLFNQMSEGLVQPKSKQDLLSEVLLKLSDYISRDDVDVSAIPDLGNGILSPVSVSDIESLLSEESDLVDSSSCSEVSGLVTPQDTLISSPNSPGGALEYMHDPDYSPPSTSSNILKSTKLSKSKKNSKSSPYKLPQDRKERKKVQNKTAALKYRQKKKEEATHVKSEVEILEEKNTKLKEKADSLTREIQYLKDLMGEVLKAKQGIK